jgi:bisphosphoglycerate-independent phosphoglycerate mutase (AlkP superfamily)
MGAREESLRRHGGQRDRGWRYADPIARVKECYHNGVTDEFVEPFVVVDEQGTAGGPAER